MGAYQLAAVLNATDILDVTREQRATWALSDLARRLVEISAGSAAAPLTAAFGLVLDAQLCGDQAAWITLESSTFFPPDAVAGGVDLAALPVVRVPSARAAACVADQLLRSGGFGLVVIDLSGESSAAQAASFPVPMLTRLVGLARAHDATVLILTKKSPETASINSLISVRVDAQWTRGNGCYDVRVHAIKDKRGGPGWTHVETCRGPAGVR